MIFYILASIGLTFIIKYGSILDWLRKPLLRFAIFKELFSCSLCIGFWSGVCIGSIAINMENDNIYILMPLVAACVSWIADIFLDVLVALRSFLDIRNK